MKRKVKKVLSEILTSAGWETDFEVKQPPQNIDADVATNIPILISKKYNLSIDEVFNKIKSYCYRKMNILNMKLKIGKFC